VFNAKQPKLKQTWREIHGDVYGAKPNTSGPIGGGIGYANLVKPTQDPVTSLDALSDALKNARSGDIVYLHGKAKIDFTIRVHVENMVLEIPEEVTLASNRGEDGAKGGMIFSNSFATRPLIRAVGPNVRITGLRLGGPNPMPCLEHHHRSFAERRGHQYYYKFPVSDGISCDQFKLEIDNCELGGWSHAAINLQAGSNHHIHHNFIHHNQYNGLGYGICHDRSFSLIEYNLFKYNRHSIAGTGRPDSGYEARHNIEIKHSLSHCFDMHGGRDRQDNTNIASTWLKIHHNTFRCPETAIVIRGKPEQGCEIHNNWFYQQSLNKSIRLEGHSQVRNNIYGLTNPKLLGQTEY